LLFAEKYSNITVLAEIAERGIKSNMEVFTANEAKNRFGEVILKSQREPVQVTKSGKPVVMVVSMEEYNTSEELKLRHVREHIAESLKDIENGHVEDGDAFFKDLTDGKYD
jgi:prevent-host-death family protein